MPVSISTARPPKRTLIERLCCGVWPVTNRFAPYLLQQRGKRPALRIVGHRRQPAVPQRAFRIDRQPGVDLHDFLRFHQQRHVQLAAIDFLAFGLRLGNARVGEADLARCDLQDLLQRKVARREFQIDQLVDELIEPPDLVARLSR